MTLEIGIALMKKYQHWFDMKLDIEMDIGMTISVRSFSRIYFFVTEKNITNVRQLFTFLLINDNRMETSHPIKTQYKNPFTNFFSY